MICLLNFHEIENYLQKDPYKNHVDCEKKDKKKIQILNFRKKIWIKTFWLFIEIYSVEKSRIIFVPRFFLLNFLFPENLIIKLFLKSLFLISIFSTSKFLDFHIFFIFSFFYNFSKSLDRKKLSSGEISKLNWINEFQQFDSSFFDLDSAKICSICFLPNLNASQYKTLFVNTRV